MKLAELPLDRWLVVEPLAFNEVKLVSTHDAQKEAEVERDKRNKGLERHRYWAIKTWRPSPARKDAPRDSMHAKLGRLSAVCRRASPR